MSDPSQRLLFTPGPLTTRESVRQAMMTDMGSREDAFIETVRSVRQGLLAVAGFSNDSAYEAVPVQGSGTYGIESALGSLIPRDGGRLLVIVNGAYGLRLAAIATRLDIETEILKGPETGIPDIETLRVRLSEEPRISHVAAVHCETTTGLLNPIAEIGNLAAESGAAFFVDAMSSFGGIPLDLEACRIDALISSANKCLESVPGLAFVLVRRPLLEAAMGNSRSVSLDLFDQWQTLEQSGQFRFTPPTHGILALTQALKELDDEGGVSARHARYRGLHAQLLAGTRALGFREVLPPDLQSPIITTFHLPRDPEFSFEVFYRLLAERGLVIYPGKLSEIDSFRIGTIGALEAGDIDRLLTGLREVLDAMELSVPVD